MRRLTILAVLLAVAGCGTGRTQRLPAGCIDGPLAFERALSNAPRPVTVGGRRISDCFTRNASSDDVQVVGTYLLTAAQELEDRAQQGDRRAAVSLGYLIGAARRGAQGNGVSSELVRRLEAETSVLGRLQGAYERGVRAGSANG